MCSSKRGGPGSRVNPKEVVEIAARFTTNSGRYMYHCEISSMQTAT